MKHAIRAFFDHYADVFRQGLEGQVDETVTTQLYTSEFIAAGAMGVRTGKNDADLIRFITDGYAHYRAIGTKDMTIRGVHVHPIDAAHALARVEWRACYERADLAPVAVDFEVSYLLQLTGPTPQIFGWIAGDEQGTLRAHGII